MKFHIFEATFSRIDTEIASIKPNRIEYLTLLEDKISSFYSYDDIYSKIDSARSLLLSQIDSEFTQDIKNACLNDSKTRLAYFKLVFCDEKLDTKPELGLKAIKLAKLTFKNEINIHKRFLYFHLSDFLINTIDKSNQTRYTNEQLYELFHLPDREYLVFNRFVGRLSLFNEHSIIIKEFLIKLIKVKSINIQIIGHKIVIVLANTNQTVHFIHTFDLGLNLVCSKRIKNILYLSMNQNFIMFESSLSVNSIKKQLSGDSKIELLNYDLQKVDQFTYKEMDSNVSVFDLMTRISLLYFLPDRFVVDSKSNDTLELSFFMRNADKTQKAVLFAKIEIEKCESYAIKVDQESRLYVIVEVFVDDYYDRELRVRNLDGGNRENLYCYDMNAKLLFKRFVAVLEDLDNVDLMNQLA